MLLQICFRYIACCTTLTSRESGQCYEENTHLSIYYLSTLPYQVILLPVESIIYSYRKRLVYKYLKERGKNGYSTLRPEAALTRLGQFPSLTRKRKLYQSSE